MCGALAYARAPHIGAGPRSEEHTSELQSHLNIVCRLLLEKKKMPHLRGNSSPTNAVLRLFDTPFIPQSFIPRAPRRYAHESARQLQLHPLSLERQGTFSRSV